ncbi:hypothetical protein AT706_07845 [Bacillus subtilis subsp. subtilis]|nr:hypothetical protein AT706_07845 [Bacillus subtilis subsp. subtilis]
MCGTWERHRPFEVFLLFYYRRMDILRKNKGCRDFLDSLKVQIMHLFYVNSLFIKIISNIVEKYPKTIYSK